MDEKTTLLEHLPSGGSPPRAMVRARGIRIFALTVILCTLFLFHLRSLSSASGLLWFSYSQPSSHQGLSNSADLTVQKSNASMKVPLEAHIMSKCPDARDCLMDLVVPAMEQIEDLVDFRLSFIGTIDKDDETHCKHGPSECLGNALALCADHLYSNNTKISLGFSTCMISSYKEIPERALVQNCALEHGVDFDRLNKCVSEDGHGMDMLTRSVERSRDAGVKLSCTVRLNATTRCIRDGGEWKDCKGGSDPKDLVRDVKKIYKALNKNV